MRKVNAMPRLAESSGADKRLSGPIRASDPLLGKHRNAKRHASRTAALFNNNPAVPPTHFNLNLKSAYLTLPIPATFLLSVSYSVSLCMLSHLHRSTEAGYTLSYYLPESSVRNIVRVAAFDVALNAIASD